MTAFPWIDLLRPDLNPDAYQGHPDTDRLMNRHNPDATPEEPTPPTTDTRDRTPTEESNDG